MKVVTEDVLSRIDDAEGLYELSDWIESLSELIAESLALGGQGLSVASLAALDLLLK